jgi:hypothetical protein
VGKAAGSRITVVLVASLALAVAAQAAKGVRQPVNLAGTLIDNQCAQAHQADLAAFVPTHTKDCALMPACVKSGYSLYTEDGKLLPFTKKSNAKIAEFLQGPASGLRVQITATKAGRYLQLATIQN